MYAGESKQFEPEWEVSFIAEDPIDQIAYIYYLYKRWEETQAQEKPREEKPGTRAGKATSGSSKGIYKQVLRSTGEEAPYRHIDVEFELSRKDWAYEV